MVSYYLNALVDSYHRATVLSFKGLAFNLGYGFVGLLFAIALKALQDGTRSPYALSQGLRLLLLWLVLALALCVSLFWRYRMAIRAKYQKHYV
jgi:hypothetical protein